MFKSFTSLLQTNVSHTTNHFFKTSGEPQESATKRNVDGYQLRMNRTDARPPVLSSPCSSHPSYPLWNIAPSHSLSGPRSNAHEQPPNPFTSLKMYNPETAQKRRLQPELSPVSDKQKRRPTPAVSKNRRQWQRQTNARHR